MLPGGLNWPLDLAVGADGNLYIADGTYFYVLRPDGTLQTVGMLFSPGLSGLPARPGPAGRASSSSPPRMVRCRATGRTSGESDVLADGFDQLYGVAIAPDGTVVAAELGTGRVMSIRPGRSR